MKKAVVIFFALCITTVVRAQVVPDFSQVKLDQPDDYRAANTYALIAANALLSNPVDKDKIDRLNCQKFLSRWMSGTPDYGFVFDNSDKFLGNDPELMAIYMASLAKFCLEHKINNADQEKIKMGSWKILLAYCGTPSNHVRVTRKIKKLMDADKKDELSKYL